jgi:hypothetical protein
VVRSFWRCEAGQAVCVDLPQVLACMAGAFAYAAGRVAGLEGWRLWMLVSGAALAGPAAGLFLLVRLNRGAVRSGAGAAVRSESGAALECLMAVLMVLVGVVAAVAGVLGRVPAGALGCLDALAARAEPVMRVLVTVCGALAGLFFLALFGVAFVGDRRARCGVARVGSVLRTDAGDVAGVRSWPVFRSGCPHCPRGAVPGRPSEGVSGVF